MGDTDNDAAITRAVALDMAASLDGDIAAILRALVRDNDRLRAELAALREPAERMRTALQEIARHRLAAEMSKEDYYDAEFEAGFDGMIGIAREALPPPPDAAP